MKKLIASIVVLFVFSLSMLNAQELFQQISFDEALEMARKQKKNIYVDITADWCLPCKLMDETVFQDQLVLEYTNDNYIAVQLDVEDFDAMILKSQYNITTLPTILFFNHKGKLIAKEEGLQTGTLFLKILKKYD